MRTISREYQALQRSLHAEGNYGFAAWYGAKTFCDVIVQLRAKSVSDYGAGWGGLKAGMDENGLKGIDYFPYDPAFPQYGEPKPADIVFCIDVLEHVEPDYLDAVLEDLERITVKRGMFTIATVPAEKQLPDGRNAHLIVQPESWWRTRLVSRFRILQSGPQPSGFYVLVAPLRRR